MTNLKKLLFLILIPVLVVGSGFYLRFKSVEGGKLSPPKNVVIINIDTLRADHMGTYGYSKNTTPFMDQLFKQGVVFENAITPGYLTFQSDAAIFSSLYPSQNNVMTWLTPINKDIPILPGVLGMYDYSTAAFVSPSLWKDFDWSSSFQTYSIDENMKNVASTKETVASWLKSQDKPFFLFWHIYDVHLPFMSPSQEFYPGIYGGTYSSDYVLGEMWKENWQKKSAFSEVDAEYLTAAYDTGVLHVDQQLQLFFESIKDEPFYKDTLFIISSEHGEDLNEHGYIFHGDLYDVNVRVPLAFIHSSLQPRRVKEAVSLLDLMPTIFEVIDVPIPEMIEGKNLVPLLSGNTTDPNRSIFTERPPYDEYSLRKGEWKYILRNPDKKIIEKSKIVDDFFVSLLSNDNAMTDELYRLSDDPMEQNNLIHKGEIREEEMRQELLSFRDKMRKARAKNNSIPVIDSTKLIPYP